MMRHRLQVLLDEERYARVAAEARRRGVSVARVIREAIDEALPADADRRRAAARQILAAPQISVPDPDELKAELDEIRRGGL